MHVRWGTPGRLSGPLSPPSNPNGSHQCTSSDAAAIRRAESAAASASSSTSSPLRRRHRRRRVVVQPRDHDVCTMPTMRPRWDDGAPPTHPGVHARERHRSEGEAQEEDHSKAVHHSPIAPSRRDARPTRAALSRNRSHRRNDLMHAHLAVLTKNACGRIAASAAASIMRTFGEGDSCLPRGSPPPPPPSSSLGGKMALQWRLTQSARASSSCRVPQRRASPSACRGGGRVSRGHARASDHRHDIRASCGLREIGSFRLMGRTAETARVVVITRLRNGTANATPQWQACGRSGIGRPAIKR